MTKTPLLINESNLSHAWGRTLLAVLDRAGSEISPLVVSINGFKGGHVEEDAEIRRAVDTSLAASNLPKVETVANTIFPQSVWRLSGRNRQEFYRLYLEEGLPSYKALAPAKNRRGLYFERLVAFGSGPHNGNQLEHIISEFISRSGVRRSMFQAAVFDPARDHVRDAQLGFPCLQHISVVPTADNELTLNAFYATQQLFDKAYGNYLGLSRLGHFLAKAMGLQFAQMNCFIGVEKLERVSKTASHLEPVSLAVRRALKHKAEEELLAASH